MALRSFLGLTFHNRKFINNFTKIATSLTNLLKKSFGIYEWDETCNEAFKSLKGILLKTHVLKLPDFAIGGVLMQDGRPVAFESKKLNKMKGN